MTLLVTHVSELSPMIIVGGDEIVARLSKKIEEKPANYGVDCPLANSASLHSVVLSVERRRNQVPLAIDQHHRNCNSGDSGAESPISGHPGPESVRTAQFSIVQIELPTIQRREDRCLEGSPRPRLHWVRDSHRASRMLIVRQEFSRINTLGF